MNPGDALSIVRAFPKYGLAPYQAILEEFIAYAGGTQNMKGKHLLELGPGTKVNLMRFLAEETRAARVTGAGRAPVWPWTRHQAFLKKHVENTFLLDYLRKVPSHSYDVIYSRHVMEQHSIHPVILLASKVYWTYIVENRFKNPGEDFPASKPNIQAIFTESYRILKSGCAIISQIAKKKYSGIDRDFLESLNPQHIAERALGKLSCIITVIK